MEQLRTEGIITKQVKYGDNSRIYTIITKDFGKISAIGRFKTGKKLNTDLQLLTYSNFELFLGAKSMYRINETSTIQPFKNLRESLEGFAYGSYFAEVANRVSVENSPDEEFLRLFLNCLYALDKGIEAPKKIKTVFELKTASVCGYTPDLSGCSLCGKEIVFLDTLLGKGFCDSCKKNPPNLLKVNETVVNAIEYICSVDIKKMFSFNATDELITYLGIISEEYLKTQLDCEFKTLDYLKKIEEM